MANKNDSPISEIDTKISLEGFTFSSHFDKVATLHPDNSKEKLVAKNVDERYSNRRGLVYLFVVDGYIQKVGSTTTTMKDRLVSYNCGKSAYRKSGTCSTTNYFVLQSFLQIEKEIEVYAFYPEIISIDVFGEIEKVSIPAKNYEKKILTFLKESVFGLPILCTQK